MYTNTSISNYFDKNFPSFYHHFDDDVQSMSQYVKY